MTALQESLIRRRLAESRRSVAPFPWGLFWIVALAALMVGIDPAEAKARKAELKDKPAAAT